MDPADEDRLWVAFTNASNGFKVFHSSNGGQSWSNLTSTELDNQNIHSLVYIPNTGEICTPLQTMSLVHERWDQ